MSENVQTINRLVSNIINSKLSHAYIFEGQNKEETTMLVSDFVMGIFCESKTGIPCRECEICIKFKHDNLEDFIHITSFANSVKDEDIIYLQRRLRNKPFAADRNIAVIDNADGMTIRAQNRLLKTLEEPNGNNIIILIVNNIGNLIQTIQSRCISIRVNDNYENDKNDDIADAYNLTDIAEVLTLRKSLYDFNRYISAISKDKDSAKEGLEILETWFRDMLINKALNEDCEINKNLINKKLIEIERKITKLELIKIIQYIEKAKSEIDRNINVAYALKSMLLNIQEEENDKCDRN